MASNEWLVRKLHEQDKKIEALSRGGTGVGHSSIAPGENLTVISDNGEVVLGAGGVEHVDGPTPATPSAPTLNLGFGTIETTWDGSFAEGEDEDGVPLTAPVDFDVVEVHCSTDPEEEEWGEDTMRGQIKTREGGTVTVGGFDVDDEVFVCLIALAKTGKRSGPSATASLVIEGLDFAQLTNELDAATVTIGNAREVLLDGQNTLGEKLDAADTALADLETTLGELDSTTLPALRNDLDAAEGRLDTAEGQITDAFGRIVDAEGTLGELPGQIDSAKDAAINTAASDATQKAIDALADARLYADQRDALTLTAAEQAAQDKADAAQAAAEAKAATAQQTADNAMAAINAGESMWLDPGFESGTGPFGDMRPEATRTTEQAYQGAWSVRIDTDGDSSNQYPNEVFVDVTPGRVYRLSVAVRSDDSLPFTAWVHEYAGASLIGAAPYLQVATSPGEWFLGSIIHTASENATRFRVIPMITGASNTSVGESLYLDNFTLTDITSGYEQYREALQAAADAQQVAGEAKAIAEAAVGAAEGGNTNFYSSSEPSGTGSLTGDLWYQVDATGGTMGLWHWDGSIWRKQTFNNEVFGDISANKITFGTMSGARIEAGSLTIGATAGLGDELDSKETPAQAQARADAAQAAAEAAAAADATAKANSAKSDAISTAASDATTKANNAASSAVSTAASNANAQYGETKSLVSGWRRANTTQIDGGTIATGTVYADSIVSGLSQNMVPDPGFLNPAMNAARLQNAFGYGGATFAIANGVLSITADGTAAGAPNVALSANTDLYAWPAYPSMKVVAKTQARVVSGTGSVIMVIRYKLRSGAASSSQMVGGYKTLTSAWGEYSWSFDFPADVASFSVVLQVNRIATNGVVEFRAPFAASSVGTTVIEQGAVTTDRLAANVLEVGNLKAGTAAIAEAVVQKIAAQTASIQQADVKNLFVTGTSSLSDVVAERIAAETAEFIQLEVGNLVAGTGTMDTATINKLFSDVVVASMAQAEQFIGENAILTGAVTAPKITASEELWAKIAQFVKIRAEHIEADAIDGMVITGPNIRTAATGARVQMDPNGVTVFNADNDVRTHLSPDGSTFKGEVEAETLVVNSGAEFKSNNTLSQGASLLLAAGVTDPTAPPVVQPYWNGLEFTPVSNLQTVGLAWDGDNYWSAFPSVSNQPGTTSGWAQGFKVSTAGVATPVELPGMTRLEEFFGVTCIGSELFWLYRKGYQAFVVVTDLNCVKLREWEYPNLGYSSTNPLTYKPGIGNDGTNIVIAHCNDEGSLVWRTFNKTTGATLNTNNMNNTAASDVTGVHVGSADFGGTRVVANLPRTGRVDVYTTTGAWQGNQSFPQAAPGSTGVVFAGGKFRTLDPSGVIYEYADPNTGDNASDWWAGYGWWKDVDNDLVAETSDYQSRMSPRAQFTWPLRAGIKIIGQPMPTGADYLMPCLAKKTTAPVRTDFHVPSWEVDAGKPVARISVLSPDWSNKISPPEVNTFPEGTSSALESASGTFQVKGDGSGRWGPLTFNADGTMTSAQIPAWVPMTGFLNGWGPYAGRGYAPAYRVWPDGKVEWRGMLTTSTPPATGQVAFTIPAAAKPAQDVSRLVAGDVTSGRTGAQLDFRTVQGNAAIWPTGTGNVPWFSLDGFDYYLT